MQTEFREWVIPAAVGITSFVTGAGTGYFLARYQAKHTVSKEDHDKLESQVVQLAFQFEERDRKNSVDFQQAARVSRDLKEASQDFLTKLSTNDPTVVASRDRHPSVGQRDEDEDVSSVFRVIDEDWDYDEEVPNRGPNVPYILHRDEFFADEKEYDNQTTLTYYEGDNVLVDELDVPIYNPENVVGKLNFGHGSGDPNVVYVRNERLEAEYEILCDHGFYQVEVLGGQAEDAIKADDLKHSVQKFRME